MANKAVFMDRDDTLIEDPGYINHPNQVRLLPGAATALIQLKKMGYLLIIASNQSGVARGIVSEEVLQQIHHRMLKLLADEGAAVDAIYYCPYHPDGVIAKYRKESDLRKPNPGMLLKAADEHDIDLSRSWMIGDSYRDIAAGKRVGCKTILIDSPIKRPMRGPSDPVPDRKVGSLREAANVIRMLDQQEEMQAAEVKPQQAQPVETSYQPSSPSEPVEVKTVETEKDQVKENDMTPIEETVAQPATAPTPEPAPPIMEPPESLKIQTPPIKEAPPEIQRTSQPESSQDMHPHPILQEILHLVRSKHRQDLYEEFSFFRLIAVITQIMALFCLILSLWFWFDSSRPATSAQMMVGYAVFLQLITIALLLLKKDR